MKTALVFSPNCHENLVDFLLHDVNEFLLRLGAILFSEECDFLYNPDQESYIYEVFDLIEEPESKRKLKIMLDRGKHVLEINEAPNAIKFYQFQEGQVIDFAGKRPFLIGQIFEGYDHVGALEFILGDKIPSDKIHLIKDEEDKDPKFKHLQILPTYNAYHKWIRTLIERTFDEEYTIHKHYDPEITKSNNWVNPNRGRSYLCCPIDVATRILPIAFFKTSDHENLLFFYHHLENADAVLFFKTAYNNEAQKQNYHAYHLELNEAQKKYKIGLENLELYSEYVERNIN